MKPRFLPELVGRTEAFFLRLFLCAAVIWSIWDPSRYDRVEDAAGIARWGVNVAWIGREGMHPWVLGLAALSGILYLVGLWIWRPILTLAGVGGLAWLHLTYWTLANSQGNTFHGSNMTTLVLLLQVAACVITLVRQARGMPNTARWTNLDGMLLYFSQCAIAAVYVASAITKLSKSQGRWLLESHLFARSIQKVWRQRYFSNPSLNADQAPVAPWASWLAEHPGLARALFAPGLVFELGGFLLLCSRGWARWFGLALIGMHLSISEIMGLHFPEFEVLLAIFCVNLPFLIARSLKRDGLPAPAGNTLTT